VLGHEVEQRGLCSRELVDVLQTSRRSGGQRSRLVDAAQQVSKRGFRPPCDGPGTGDRWIERSIEDPLRHLREVVGAHNKVATSLGTEVSVHVHIGEAHQPDAAHRPTRPRGLTFEEPPQCVHTVAGLPDGVDRLRPGGPRLAELAVGEADVSALHLDDHSTCIRKEHQQVDLDLTRLWIREAHAVQQDVLVTESGSKGRPGESLGVVSEGGVLGMHIRPHAGHGTAQSRVICC
jgi:hypothetical protein